MWSRRSPSVSDRVTQTRRVAVTGAGIVSSLGHTLNDVAEALANGHSPTNSRLLGSAIIGGIQGRLQGLLAPDFTITRSNGGFLPIGNQVFQPEFHRVHLQLPGDAIHVGFAAEQSLRLARSSHKPAGNRVGVNVDGLDVGMGDSVGPAGLGRAAQVNARRWFEAPVGTAVKHHLSLMGYHGAIPLDSGFELDHGGVPRIAGGEFFQVVHHHSHRASRMDRQEIGHRNVHGGTLPPVISANGYRIDP